MFAERIKEWLAESGWSQTDLASKLGVSRSLICKWVKGDRQPHSKHWRTLMALGVDLKGVIP